MLNHALLPPSVFWTASPPIPVVPNGPDLGGPSDTRAGDSNSPSLKAAAEREDFAYPLHGTDAAAEFLDRLEEDLGPRNVATAHLVHARDATSAGSDYWSRPWEAVVQAYVEMLRTGHPVDAAHFRRAVIASFQRHSDQDARLIDHWLDHAESFCRRAADLTASVYISADENTRPFAEAELADQVERGLRLLYLDSAVPPTLTTTQIVLARAAEERLRRIAEINNFYEAALGGEGIAGLSARKDRATYQLLAGRLIFKDAASALEMAPRAVRLRTWVGFSPFNTILYGPLGFPGLRASSIEYIDPAAASSGWNFPDETYTTVGYDPGDGRTAEDKFRLGKGPWQRFPRMTTLELELLKADWYVKLQAAAARIRG